MSRTFRRKNYEDTQGGSWARKGRKTAGFYTEREYEYFRQEDEFSYWWVENRWYRAPTEREYGKEYWRIHGDSNCSYYWSNPSPWFRNNEQRRERMHGRQELIKFMKNPDEYEVMIYDKWYLPYWD